METQRQIEILGLMNNHLKTVTFPISICGALQNLFLTEVITVNENYFIQKLLIDNKPTTENQYKEFTQNEYWLGSTGALGFSYWWERLPQQARQIRIAYLEALITNIK